MSKESRTCPKCNLSLKDDFAFCPHCGTHVKTFESSVEAIPDLRLISPPRPEPPPPAPEPKEQEGLATKDSSLLDHPVTAGGSVRVNGSVQSSLILSGNYNKIQNLNQSQTNINNTIYQRDLFRFSPGDLIAEVIFPHSRSDMERRLHAGPDSHFLEAVVNLKAIFAQERVQFDKSVIAVEHALFGPHCSFGGDIICGGETSLDQFDVKGSVVSNQLELKTAGVVQGDLLCEHIKSVSGCAIPPGTRIDGMFMALKPSVIHLGREGTQVMSQFGAVRVEGEVHVWGPVEIGEVRSNSNIYIHGPAQCDEIHGLNVHLLGKDVAARLVSCKKSLIVSGQADIRSLAVAGDIEIEVEGHLNLGVELLVVWPGQLRLKEQGRLTLKNQKVDREHLFSLDAQRAVSNIAPDKPVRLVSLRLTRDLLSAIQAAAQTQLLLREP